MKLFSSNSIDSKAKQTFQDDTSNDGNTSDKLLQLEKDLAKQTSKESVQYKQTMIAILEEYVNLSFSLAKICSFLEKYMAKIDFGDSIVLQSACCKGDLKFVQLLLQEFPEQTRFDAFYQRPIQYAVQSGNAKLVEFLLMQPSVDPSHITIPTLAVIGNNLDIVSCLLRDNRIDKQAWSQAANWADELHKTDAKYYQVLQKIRL